MATNRRQFLKRSLTIFGAAPALTILGKDVAFAQANLSPIDPTSAKASSFGYYEDGSKVDKAKWSRYEATQNCANCQLYLQGGVKLEGKEGEWGKCALFAEGLVSAKGWCNSWVAKPG